MDVFIKKIQYKQAYDLISRHEYELIKNNIPCLEDGTYRLTNRSVAVLIEKFSDKEEFQSLLKTFYKYIKLGKGYLYFRII